MEQKNETLLEIHDLSVSFRMYDGTLEQKDLQVISDLHLTVRPGEIVAVAGSSGSGKSLLASAILGILPGNATVRGHLHYKGKELTPQMQETLRGSEIALVPQSVAFLDPLMKVGKQADGHKKPYPTEKRRGLFKRFGLPEKTENLYPFQLSGGMARRVLVSTALITDAQLIIADVNKVAGQEIRAVPYLHWWTFLSWFHAISQGQLSTLVAIRDKLSRGQPLERWEKEFYAQNKKKVDLQPRLSQREREEKQRLQALLGN